MLEPHENSNPAKEQKSHSEWLIKNLCGQLEANDLVAYKLQDIIWLTQPLFTIKPFCKILVQSSFSAQNTKSKVKVVCCIY